MVRILPVGPDEMVAVEKQVQQVQVLVLLVDHGLPAAADIRVKVRILPVGQKLFAAAAADVQARVRILPVGHTLLAAADMQARVHILLAGHNRLAAAGMRIQVCPKDLPMVVGRPDHGGRSSTMGDHRKH